MSDTAAPRWLEGNQDMRRFLRQLVDELHAERAQPQLIQLTRSRCPFFYRALDEHADWLWELFQDVAARGLWEIKAQRRSRADCPEYQRHHLRVPYCAKAVFCAWLGIANPDQALLAWRAAVADYALPAALGDKILSVPERSERALAQQCQRLLHSTATLTLYQFSARYFWGDSKFLARHPRLVALLLPPARIKPRQALLHFYMPPCCEQLLLVENQDSYLELVSSGYARQHNLAIGFMAGYKGAEQHIRIAAHHSIHWHPHSADADSLKQQLVEQWLAGFSLPLYYWGDLDSEGLHIFNALQQQLPELQAWQPGYQALLAELHAGNAHRKSGQRPLPETTASPWLNQQVLPALQASELAVDQEAVILGLA